MSRPVEAIEQRFRTLYDAISRDLLAYLLRRSTSPEDAADALAETFLIAWDKRPQLPDLDQDARPWLFGIARNVIRRGNERQTRASAAITRLANELAGMQRPTVDHDDPVTEALLVLLPVDREIIEMSVWDQLTPREIAAVLGLSPNVVRVRAHRARQKLKETIRTITSTKPELPTTRSSSVD